MSAMNVAEEPAAPPPSARPPAPHVPSAWRAARVRMFLRRHPLVAYLALTFAIAWGGILLLIGPGGVPVDAEHLAVLIGLGYVAMLAGSSVTALLLAGLIGGHRGLRAFGSRLLTWRVGARWYALALLVVPLSLAAVLYALSLASPVFVPRLLTEDDRAGLVQFSLVAALLTGVFEELGWTGFATHALLERRQGVLRTGLVVGVLYAAWSGLVVYLREAADPTPGTLPLPLYLAVGLFTWQPAYRVLMVWAYDRTRSLPLAMLLQTSLVAAWTSLNPLGMTRETLVVFYLVLAAVWLALARAVALPAHQHTRSLKQRGSRWEVSHG